MELHFIVYFVFVILLNGYSVLQVGGAPKRHIQTSDDSSISQDVVYDYLMEFDYLPKSDIESGALRTEEQLQEAIRNLQRFGNIPVSGKVDEATKQLIKKPRCGVGDSNRSFSFSPDNLHHGNRFKRYVLQGSKWNKTDLTWSLVNKSMPDVGLVRTALTQALRVWERSSKLTFREVYSSQADIQVLFARRDHGDGYKFDGPGQVLAHAFYPAVARGGDAHFDDEENWIFTSDESSDGTNFLGVAVHEFGHSLGLGHSSDQNAVMFPWYHGYEVDANLPDDDRLAIQELYGSREKTWGPFKNPRPYVPTPTTTTTTTTTTMRTLSYYPERRYPNYEYHNSPHNPSYPYHHNHHNYPKHRHEINPQRPHVIETTVRPRHNKTRTTSRIKPRKEKPDSCFTKYDAISIIRRELFIFRGQFMWRIGDRGLYAGFPTEARRQWSSLPENFTKIDAVYENHDRKIVFFIGRYYYVFDSARLLPGYPKLLTTLGLPSSLTHIDAAFIWGHNNKTYLFSGTLYWSLDEDTNKIILDYPRDISIWSGIGYNIDAAFQYTNGKTYFFKGLKYWEFADDRMRVAHPQPKLSAGKWMNCPQRTNDYEEERTGTARLISEDANTDRNVDISSAAAASLPRRTYFYILTVIFSLSSHYLK